MPALDSTFKNTPPIQTPSSLIAITISIDTSVPEKKLKKKGLIFL